MRFFSVSLILLAARLHSPLSHPENGNLIQKPKLADYSQANRAPGIMGAPEEVQDAEGNPASL